MIDDNSNVADIYSTIYSFRKYRVFHINWFFNIPISWTRRSVLFIQSYGFSKL